MVFRWLVEARKEGMEGLTTGEEAILVQDSDGVDEEKGGPEQVAGGGVGEGEGWVGGWRQGRWTYIMVGVKRD